MNHVPESHLDLLDVKVATLATIDPSGRPQLSAVWFRAEADSGVLVSINRRRRKVRNLEENGACTLFILDPKNPYRYLELRGHAELTPDPDYQVADQIATKYDSDFRKYDKPGDQRVAVLLRIEQVTAYGTETGKPR